MLTNDCPQFFFANFTATKDEKYFRYMKFGYKPVYQAKDKDNGPI